MHTLFSFYLPLFLLHSLDSTKRLFVGSFGAGGPKRKKDLFLGTLFSSLLLAAAVFGIASIVHGSSSHGNSASRRLIETTDILKNYFTYNLTTTPESHAVIRTACSSAHYPELCFSAVASTLASANGTITSHKDVIEAFLNLTTTAVQHNFFTVEKLMATRGEALMRRDRAALHDCLEMIDKTLDELRDVVDDLNMYPTKKPLQQYADDLNILMRAAMTNQETCLDGFSHDEGDTQVHAALHGGQIHVEKMCSNALAMIKNMTDTDIETERRTMNNSNLRHEEKPVAEAGWPGWLSPGDRKLLQSAVIKPNVVVAADGSGNHKTVAAAVAAAPAMSRKRFIIKIKAGVYNENVVVPSTKTNIMFIGDGRTNTIITGNRSFRGGSSTFDSATVAVVGNGFLARDLTFKNTAGHAMQQAVALRVEADFSAFYQCDILAFQDTLYVHSKRQFFVKCLIAGTVDFIFGNSAAIFQDCDILARRPGPGQMNMMTAHGRTDPKQNTGIVIQKCRIGATSELEPVKRNIPTYLGRPWKLYSRTVIMQSTISDVIHPAGWHEWNRDFALNTLYYGEYHNNGIGAVTDKRVAWKGFKVITSESEAQIFTAERFIGGKNWLASTGFPYSLGF